MSKFTDNKYNECYFAINDGPGKGPLSKYTCAVKDNVTVKDYPTTAGSHTLTKYIPNFDATIVKLLKEAGINIVGKAALDEFGMGGTGQFSHQGPVVNPLNKDYQTGGSSSGSAVAVCDGIDIAIGTDTGDSIRIPAEFTKIIGLKPSYGALSRYGVIPYAASLDHAGYFTRSFSSLEEVMKITMVKDENDLTSVDYSNVKPVLPKDLKSAKVAYLKDVYDAVTDEMRKDFDVVLNKFKEAGNEIEAISLAPEIYPALGDTYTIIANTEGLQANFAIDGINFGNKESTYDELRGLYGPNVQSRFLLASHYLYNDKNKIVDAYKFRRYIVNLYQSYLDKYDFIISINSESGVKKIEDSNPYYTTNHLVIHNFGGFPSLTFPMVDHGDRASAVNICSWKGNDFGVIELAKLIRGDDNV